MAHQRLQDTLPFKKPDPPPSSSPFKRRRDGDDSDSSHRPLKRTMRKKKPCGQRENVINDVVSLHSRRMAALTDAKDNVKKMEKTLAERCKQWQTDLEVVTQCDVRLRELKKENSAADARNDKAAVKAGKAAFKKEYQRRKTLFLQLERDREAIKEQERYIIGVKTDSLRNEYLLDSIPYLNAHHAANAIVLKTKAKLALESTTDEEKKILREQSNQALREKRSNAHAYTVKFFPDLVRARDVESEEKALVNDPFVCTHCGGCIEEVENSICVCTECATVAHVGFSLRDPTANLNWEDIKNLPGRQYTYRRLNHFREYLRQVQGISRAQLPPDLFVDLRAEFHKVRIPDENITPRRVRMMLKKIGQSKFYEHSEAIASRMNPSYHPVSIPPAHEEKLCLMFVQLEEPYEEIKHKVNRNRKNFLSYPFTFFKLNELNGWDTYNRGCYLLKSPTLISRQDEWWALVMKKLGWEVVGRTFDIHH